MKKSNWVIVGLAVLILVLAGCYINTRSTMKFYEAQYELRILNYEAKDYCLQLALDFCRPPEMTTGMYDSDSDMEHPAYFEGSRSILGIYQKMDVHDLDRSPLVTFFVDYLVLTPGETEFVQESHVVRQSVQLTKGSPPDGDGWWKAEILNYQDISVE